MALSPGDPSSYARPDHVKTTHIHLGKHTFFLGCSMFNKYIYSFFKGSNNLGLKEKRQGLKNPGFKSLTFW